LEFAIFYIIFVLIYQTCVLFWFYILLMSSQANEFLLFFLCFWKGSTPSKSPAPAPPWKKRKQIRKA